MERCGISSERVGRQLTTAGAEGAEDWGGRAQQETTPTSIGAVCFAPNLPVSPFLEAGSVCAQDLLRCGLVCEFSKALAHVYFSLSPEHTASIQEKSDLKPAVLALLQEAVCDSGLPQIC